MTDVTTKMETSVADSAPEWIPEISTAEEQSTNQMRFSLRRAFPFWVDIRLRCGKLDAFSCRRLNWKTWELGVSGAATEILATLDKGAQSGRSALHTYQAPPTRRGNVGSRRSGCPSNQGFDDV